MFSVYGTSGRLFRGSMEQLRQVGGVAALARARSVAAVGQDGRDAAGAVSYTHLDVYKRQLSPSPTTTKTPVTATRRTASSPTLWGLSLIHIYVYKRQAHCTDQGGRGQCGQL